MRCERRDAIHGIFCVVVKEGRVRVVRGVRMREMDAGKDPDDRKDPEGPPFFQVLRFRHRDIFPKLLTKRRLLLRNEGLFNFHDHGRRLFL